MYKRTKTDSPLKCPYCGKQFNMNGRRNPCHGLGITSCKKCGRDFYFRNITAETAREHGIRATFTMEEVRHWNMLFKKGENHGNYR